MLPKPQRLTRNFEIVFQKGAKIFAPFFILHAISALDEVPRLAVSVSKKTEKTAVRRNQIRRRLIAAAKKAGFSALPQKPFRIVIIGKHETLHAEFSELVISVSEAFKKLESWRFPERKIQSDIPPLIIEEIQTNIT